MKTQEQKQDKNKQSRLRILWAALRGSRLLFAGATLTIALAALVSLVDPLILRYTLDTVIGGQPAELPSWLGGLLQRLGGESVLAQNIWLCAIGFALAGLLYGLLMFVRGLLAALAAEKTAQNLRNTLFGRLNVLPYRYFATANTGDLVQRCTSDVETVRRFLATQFVDIGRALALLAFTVTIMLQIDVGMTLVALPIIPVVTVFSYFFFLKIQKAFQASDEAEGELSGTLQEILQGVRVVKAFARQDFERERFDARNRKYTGVTRRLIDLFGWYWSISGWMCMAQTGAVLVVGAMWAASGRISVGTFVVFLAYVGRLMWPVRQLGRTLTDLGKTLVALGRIGHLLSESTEYDNDGSLQPDLKGAVEFDDVHFAWDQAAPVLKGVSFRVEAGETVAILGRTGSGKTALVQLLARLAEPDSGSVRIGGVDLKHVSKQYLRDRVGLVPQEPFLFSRTLAENLAMGRGGEAPQEDLQQAAETAGLAKVIDGFEKGWETPVGEEGVTLSGGQRQRAAIARVLLKRPDLLVLDDSLSAVDTETDSAIRSSLKKRQGGVTTIIVSHRMTTLAAADRIIVLEDGLVSDSGTHEELVARPGLYRRVWEIQRGLEAAGTMPEPEGVLELPESAEETGGVEDSVLVGGAVA
ncbi:MAG: ABC transporter ATP-binding protein/permease [Spirochaetes bacterium]|nr:ABC transporter ATP-binding protein/permease [Spirochaetota bacterium]MBU0956191.1 ABC transporter ATP-binding protein/permease [Spirochaetota bacterium]